MAAEEEIWMVQINTSTNHFADSQGHTVRKRYPASVAHLEHPDALGSSVLQPKISHQVLHVLASCGGMTSKVCSKQLPHLHSHHTFNK